MRFQADLIMADVPWVFSTWSDKGKGKSPDQHYKTMTTEELSLLPVSKVSAKDCLLLFWTTWPHLEQALSMMNRWDFHYASGLPWVKRRENGVPKMIMGYYVRHCSELLLIGKRGKSLPRQDFGVVGLLDTIAPKEHSRKPPEVYAMIDQVWGKAIRKLELFARPPLREGWTQLGDAVDGLDIKVALNRLIVGEE